MSLTSLTKRITPKYYKGMWVNIAKAVAIAVLTEVVKVLVEDNQKK